ncbi:MAG: TorF family putative porin [Opitutaceae bacterium]|nr:TorF family putative porin [Opitutaceae bacterium]
MNQKLLLTSVFAATLGAAVVRAQTTPPSAPAPAGVSITATATAVSQYMFRGQRLGGLSFQPAIECGSGSSVLGIWSNFPIKDEVPDTSDPEFDLYGSYNFTVSDVLSIVPGFTWYTYPDAPTAAGFYRSTFEPNVALNYTVGGVKLTPKVYYDLRLEGPTYEFTAAYALPLKDIGSELDFVGTVGSYYVREAINNSRPATKAWGDYWLIGVSAPFQITPKGKLTVGFAYTKGTNAFAKQGTAPRFENSLAVGRGVVTLSYSHSF